MFPFIIVYFILLFIADRWLSARPYRGRVTDHFNGKKFYSIGLTPGDHLMEHNDWKLFLKWVRHRATSRWHKRANRFTAKPRERVMGSELVVTFINHATMLIQT